MNRPVFWVNSFNKSEWTYRACASALAQTMPCHVLFTDMQSSDDSWAYIELAVKEAPRGANHTVTWLKTPTAGVSSFDSLNEHFKFALKFMDEQFPESEWLLQCSSDDISLPHRAQDCMDAVERHPCSAVANTMFFAKPEEMGISQTLPISGFPTQTGYVRAGEGLLRLAYGSVIAGYSKTFLKKVGGFSVTPDVYYGFLAALDKGFYVVANPAHIHINHAAEKNLGFGGKLLAAQGDELDKLNELNQFQLYRIYRQLVKKISELYPQGIPQDDLNALYSMMLNHSIGWYEMREILHQKRIIPSIL